MLALLYPILLAFTTVDTLDNITRIKVYNQVGNVKVVYSNVPFLKITEYSADTTKSVFNVKKSIKREMLTLEIKPKMSCSECGADITIGIDSLKYLDIEVTSGNVETRTGINQLSLSVMSGNVQLEGNFDRLTAEVLSGNLKINTQKLDTLDISVSSGSVIAKLQNIVYSGKINVLVGSINLHIPQNQALSAILLQKQDTIKKEGKGNLVVKVTSGNLKIANNK